MSRILFACYHRLEYGTVSPVVGQLRSLGHETAFLGLLSDQYDFPPSDGPTFRCRDIDISVHQKKITTSSKDLVCQLLSTILSESAAMQVADVVKETEPGLDGIFPLRIYDWVPHWRREIETAFADWLPDLVVLSLGQFETPVVRDACSLFGIPCVYFLTPFYEFKDIERMPLFGEFKTTDQYFVAGPIGKRKLHRDGIPERNIVMTGAPLFESVVRLRPKMREQPRISILYADQRLPENARLGERLLKYVAGHPESRLVIRSHPSSSSTERTAWQSQIDNRQLNRSARISEEGTVIEEDFAEASVVVSISSVSLYEAILVGIPAICWHPGFLPPEIAFHAEFPIQVVKTFRQLEAALDRVASEKPIHDQSVRDDNVIESIAKNATNRVVDSIMSFIRSTSSKCSMSNGPMT